MYWHNSSVPRSLYTGQGVKIALNQLYNASPLNDGQKADNMTPFYEEVAETRSPTAQYVNVSPSDSSTRDSILVNNPIYGDDDDEVNGNENAYTAPIDHGYQTSSEPPVHSE